MAQFQVELTVAGAQQENHIRVVKDAALQQLELLLLLLLLSVP